MTWIIVFYICLFCIFHSYVIYPYLLYILAIRKKNNELQYKANDPDLPSISILMAVHNEEGVIRNKLESVYNTTYPLDRTELIIGSDDSTDKTNLIIEEYKQKYPCLKLIIFHERSGKIKIINELSKIATGEIFIMTDANVFFEPYTINQLVKHYKNPRISIVGGNIYNSGLRKDGISIQEKTYISRENQIKYLEGLLWGVTMGVFGGCYSIRAKCYTDVPDGFVADDFYLTMNVLVNKGISINEPEGVAHEDVSNKLSEEFRRKIRISIGNFQNLAKYKRVLLKFYTPLGFSFFSHKVLRWLGPIFIIFCLISNIFIINISAFYKITLISQILLLLIPLLDWILRKLKVHLYLLRFITHFYMMNLSLLIGLIKYIRGINTNIWQPTQRNQ